MSLQELPGSFGFMLPACSLPMKAERSRNKERLEASLAGLCELELLKQRQECRVFSALCLGDSPVPGRPPWGALRSARCSLDAPKSNASGDYSLRLHHVSSFGLTIVLLSRCLACLAYAMGRACFINFAPLFNCRTLLDQVRSGQNGLSVCRLGLNIGLLPFRH